MSIIFLLYFNTTYTTKVGLARGMLEVPGQPNFSFPICPMDNQFLSLLKYKKSSDSESKDM